jgi:hypothetical protein
MILNIIEKLLSSHDTNIQRSNARESFVEKVITLLGECLLSWIIPSTNIAEKDKSSNSAMSHQQKQEYVLQFIVKLLELDSVAVLRLPSGRNLLEKSFAHFMSRPIPLHWKAQALPLLPSVLQAYPQLVCCAYTSRVVCSLTHNGCWRVQAKERLNEMVIYDFPSNSRDLQPISSLYPALALWTHSCHLSLDTIPA